MLVVKIYDWPRGEHQEERLIGLATLQREGRTAEQGSYWRLRLFDRTWLRYHRRRRLNPEVVLSPPPDVVIHESRVGGHRRASGVYELLGGALARGLAPWIGRYVDIGAGEVPHG